MVIVCMISDNSNSGKGGVMNMMIRLIRIALFWYPRESTLLVSLFRF